MHDCADKTVRLITLFRTTLPDTKVTSFMYLAVIDGSSVSDLVMTL